VSKRYLGALLIAVSAFGFGLMPLLALYAYEGGATVGTVLSCRFIITAAVFFVCVALQERQISLTRKQVFSLVLLGGVLYMLQSTTYLTAVRFISPSLAALILYTYPIMVAVLSFIVENEPIGARSITAIVISLGGVFLMLGVSGEAVNIKGVLFALSAAIVYSCYIVIGNRVVKQLPSIVTSAYVALFAAASLLLVSLVTGDLHFSISIQSWLAILGIAVFSTVMAMLAFFRGLELVGSTQAAILSTTEPLVTVCLSALLLGERLSALQLLGGLAVVTGAVLAATARHDPNRHETSSSIAAATNRP
jgi:drug/metabolite transporter (DMT)-like permease